MDDIIIRPVTYGELLQVAQVMAKAFWDDPLWGERMHPHRNKHPSDVEMFWFRLSRVEYWDYAQRWLVAIMKDDSGEDSVVGVIQWVRKGRGGHKMRCHWLDPSECNDPHIKIRRALQHVANLGDTNEGNLTQPLSRLAMQAHLYVWPNKAMDPAMSDLLARAHPFMKDTWTGERAEGWYLSLLAVHPDFQGRGVGRRLVKPGMDWAEEERVCVSVISGHDKDRFYKHCGFQFQDGNSTWGEGNPLSGLQGGNILWRVPA